MFKRIICLVLLILSAVSTFAQTDDSKKVNTEVQEVEVPIMTQVGSTQYKGHTIPHVILPALPKYAPLTFKNDKEREEGVALGQTG